MFPLIPRALLCCVVAVFLCSRSVFAFFALSLRSGLVVSVARSTRFPCAQSFASFGAVVARMSREGGLVYKGDEINLAQRKK